MDDKLDVQVIQGVTVDDDLDFDAMALITHIRDATGNRPFILIVHNQDTGATRQFSNGDTVSQLELLEVSCEATRQAGIQLTKAKH